ncbi:MAG: VWA domain-containing protein [Terriglobia bacterium]|nr:VWA domain-containing protein [Terriglobia bacterium]
MAQYRAPLISIALLVTLGAFAQAPGQTPSIRVQTNLVLVPVQVRDHNEHVPGLKEGAFTVLEDGKPQKIAVFDEVRTTTQRLQQAPVGPHEFTNQLTGNPETARYTIIAIDRINTGAMDMNRVRQGLTTFLMHTADTGEPIRLISIELNGIRMLQDFTTDPRALAAALERSTKGVGKSEQSSVNLDETLQERENVVLSEAAMGNLSADEVARYLQTLDNTKDQEQNMIAFQERNARINSLEALQQVALSLTGLPGRKSLVWASSGYPFSSVVRQGRSAVRYDFSQIGEATALDAYTTQLLSAANIAMYPVDARGLVNTAWDAMDPSHKYSPTYAEKNARQEMNQDVLTTFERLAAGTGGKPCYNRPELSSCFKEALDDSRDYYMVGFYVDSKNTKEGWHKLQVKVDEKGANVRARNGFLFPLPDPSQTRDLDMSTAVQSLLLDAGVPFKGQWTTTQRKGNKIANSFFIQVLPSANVLNAEQRKLNVEFAAVARTKDGAVAGQFAQTVNRTLPPEAVDMIEKGGITYRNTLDLPPGEYLVRFVVRDNLTGRTGAANSFLKVQ